MPSTVCASARSSAKSSWVSARITSAPCASSRSTAAAAVAIAGAKVMSGPGEDSTAVSGVSSPKKPIR